MELVTFSQRMQLTPIHLDEIQAGEGFTDAAKQRLQDFKSQASPGDSIYHYLSDPEEWARGMGSEGYIVVRNGEVIAEHVSRMN